QNLSRGGARVHGRSRACGPGRDALLLQQQQEPVRMGLLTTSPRRVVLCVLAMLTVAQPALAQDLSPINNFFTTLGDALTGTTGRAIGLVALAGVGLMFLTGRMNWG